MKKILTGLVTVGLLLGALASCSNPASVQTTTTQPTATGIISGKVTESQLPAAGVKVSLVSASVTVAPSTSSTIVAQVTTDSQGDYTFLNVTPGSWNVIASSSTTVQGAVYTGLSVSAGATVSALSLELTPTGSISGNATLGSATGNSGITVFLAGTSYQAKTADDGSYTISGIPVGTNYLLIASDAGYSSSSPQTLSVTAQTTTPATSITLTKPVGTASTGSVTGTVNSSTGTPVGGALIYLQGSSNLASTGSNGTFTLTGVNAGTYTLVAQQMGGAFVTESVTVTNGASTAANVLTLPAPVVTTGSVTGTVLSSSGAPVAGALIYLQGTSYLATSTLSGSFVLNGVAAGNYTLGALQAGGATASTSVTVTAGQNTTASNLTVVVPTVTVTVVGSTGTIGSVTGSVTTSTLQPVVGALVYLQGTAAMATTASDGTFTLVVATSGTYTLVAQQMGGSSITESVTVTTGATTSANVLTFPASASTLSLNSATETLVIGRPYQLTAQLNPITVGVVAWSSSDTTIATVSNNGLVTPIAPGSCTITVTMNSVSATCQITSNNVVASGSVWNSNTEQAAYWVNDQLSLLSSGGYSVSAGLGMFTSGSDFYEVGWVGSGFQNPIPAVWKDGQLTTLSLPSGVSVGEATQGCVDPLGNVYIGDSYGINNGNIIGYWKNETWVSLPVTLQGSSTSAAVAVERSGPYLSGTDIYFTGDLQDPSVNNNQPIPVYWKNGVINYIALSSLSGAIGGWVQGVSLIPSSAQPSFFITYQNGTYPSGSSSNLNNYCAIFQNSTLTPYGSGLPGEILSTNTSPDGHVYAAGYENQTVIAQSNAPVTNQLPSYTKDGQTALLPLPAGMTNGIANGAYFSGNDIYISAAFNNNTASVGSYNSSGSGVGGYYMNGIFNELTLGNYSSSYVGGMDLVNIPIANYGTVGTVSVN